MSASSAPSSTAIAPCDIGPLVERLRPALRRVLRRFGVPPHDADDLLQEVFLAAVSKWDEIENKEGWMLGTLRNRCAIYWRRRHASPFDAVDADLLEALSRPQPAPQERAALVWDLESLFANLPLRHRDVLWLRFGMGLATEEVAERLGYSPTSIRKLIGRSLERLRLAAISAIAPAAAPSSVAPAVRRSAARPVA
jgi:RNA polymerase sigma-70 factor (ECF subfamily)